MSSATTTIFAEKLAVHLACKFEGVEASEFQGCVVEFINESKLAVPVPDIAKKAAKAAKADKPAAEKKPRRSSAAKEAEEIFKQFIGKFVIITTAGKPTFVAFNGVANAKKIAALIKAAIKGKSISEKSSKDYGEGLMIPEKNTADVMDQLCEILSENDIEFEHHTHVKAVKPPTAYNLFQKKAKSDDPSLSLTAIAALWKVSDEKKASDAAAEEKKAAAKAESEAKKAAKAAEKAAKAAAAK
jgi:hypothetical protein